MNDQNISLGRAQESILATNKVLKNTYALLSMTLIFSGLMAFVGVSMGLGHGAALVADIVAIGMLWFVLPRTANSTAGIPVIFAITGLLGLGLGPVVNYYLAINADIVMTALGGTGVIFLGLSGYALTTRKDFSFMAGFLMVGMLVVIGAALLNIFMEMPMLFLAVNAAVVLIMSGFILYETSSIIHGGETNYIMATASLFLSILNLFQALLHLLGAFSNND
ncbi:MAG: Bax inhibitor-1/YccA family protein [Gammaproteobacteria bacterium]|nr:Bax inhibitor-1/YccA family protein [Gammaproteobacteria bacterium]MCW8911574.1 Bax inhibitor-1/YccA family protein [Gammaproteobacteria bacterium]MCW9005823.1 Bax inhibitor-1/YccA family protein [Gammaproteobacteria bacterium]MCW9056440.1 Bax inhibitor-1/YccA family protein [Gammaproteobacteria bacterium]